MSERKLPKTLSKKGRRRTSPTKKTSQAQRSANRDRTTTTTVTKTKPKSKTRAKEKEPEVEIKIEGIETPDRPVLEKTVTKKTEVLVIHLAAQEHSAPAEHIKNILENGIPNVSTRIEATPNAIKSAMGGGENTHVVVVFDSPSAYLRRIDENNLTMSDALKHWYNISNEVLLLCRKHRENFTLVNSEAIRESASKVCESVKMSLGIDIE